VRILITGACGVTPRAIARSLRISPRLGTATLIGTDRGGNWYGFYEGLYDRIYRVPDTADPRYVAAIGEICTKESIGVAIVSPEAEVRFWSGREFPVPTLLPSSRIVGVAISKKSLYDSLQGSGLIPSYTIVSRTDLLVRRGLDFTQGPVWLRDFADASSSGIGSIKVGDAEQAYAWAYLHPAIAEYMVAEFLPGRNFACNILFQDDALLKVACYERLEYFGGHLIVSGVSGNISRGTLVNDPRLLTVAEQAIRAIVAQHDEVAHGLFTVDLREAADGSPKVTEINIRHTAATSALAAGGANLAEAQVLAALGRHDEIGDVVVSFTEDNVILRDIDGPPLLLTHRAELEVGEAVDGVDVGRPSPALDAA
jgi:carbamoyl-phosphate synthase large subunit